MSYFLPNPKPSTSNRQQPTGNNQQPTTNCQLPTTNLQQPSSVEILRELPSFKNLPKMANPVSSSLPRDEFHHSAIAVLVPTLPRVC
mmetsp:Transcript_10938/g.20384  ORF Transcript_10938/g.20384 Transcript_10938/m.20384 type:complete len:87 (+) Transcript_10938:190-450(+)